MHKAIPLNDHACWVGVNDRSTDLFEGLWPIPRGVSYNSYLILDDKVALIDTVKKTAFEEYLGKIRSILGDEKVDYLIANHLEPDHSGSYRMIREIWPEVKIVGNAKTIEFLQHLYGLTENMITVADGDTLKLGAQTLKFVTVPMVHWPESMVTYEVTTRTLYSNDAFGGFGRLEGGIFDDEHDTAYFEDEVLRYFSNIVGKYSTMVQRAFKKLEGVDIACVAPSHGLVWRRNPGEIIGLYDKWSRQEAEMGIVVLHASMYGNTTRMLEAVMRGIATSNMPATRVHDVARSHPSFIIRDAWRYKGMVIGCPTYDVNLFPPMRHVVEYLQAKQLKNRILGVFGNYGWSGGAVKALKAFAEKENYEMVEPVVESRFTPTEDDLNRCQETGANLARRVREACES